MPSPRIARLDGREEIGDPKAPPGSLGWVRSLRFQTNQLKRDARMSALLLKGSLEALLKEERWRQLVDEDGRPWSAWEWFCQHHEPWGLGMSPEQVAAILAETDPNKTIGAVLGRHGGDRGNQHTGGKSQGCNATLPRGTVAHWLARLEREATPAAAKEPLFRTDEETLALELLPKVRAGEVSANEAALRMGWRKPPDPLERLRRDWERTPEDARREFLRGIGATLAGEPT